MKLIEEDILELLRNDHEEENTVNKICKIKVGRRYLTYWHCGRPMVKIKNWRPYSTYRHPNGMRRFTDIALCTYKDCPHHRETGDYSDLHR